MKKIILLSTAIFVMFLTTGCVKYSYVFDIDKKGNITLSETEAINLSSIKAFDKDNQIAKDLNEQKSKLEKEGYEVSIYDENGYQGLTRKHRYEAGKFYVDNLPAGFKSKNETAIASSTPFWGKKIYSINWTYSFNEASKTLNDGEKINNMYTDDSEEGVVESYTETDEDGNTIEIKKYDDGSVSKLKYNKAANDNFNQAMTSMLSGISELQPQAELVITIPYKSINHNADSVVNNNEYHWNLLKNNGDGEISIVLEYVSYNVGTFVGIIALIIMLISFIILPRVLNKDEVVY